MPVVRCLQEVEGQVSVAVALGWLSGPWRPPPEPQRPEQRLPYPVVSKNSIMLGRCFFGRYSHGQRGESVSPINRRYPGFPVEEKLRLCVSKPL